jgi:hypothetical protein
MGIENQSVAALHISFRNSDDPFAAALHLAASARRDYPDTCRLIP